jgi:parallel beta-helix repeat protein
MIGFLLNGVLSSRAATAATYYVATTGNNDNPGTQAQPFRTIQKGLDTLRAGDTLYLRGGKYNEGIRHSKKQPVPSGTSWTNPVTIAGYPGENVTLRGGVSLMTYGDSLRYLVFDNLSLDGRGFYVRGPEAQHIRFQNSEVKNSPTHGIQGYDAAYIEFINLKVHDNGSTRLHHGFYVAMQHMLIDGCDIYNNSGYGIHIYDRNCTTYDCADNTTIRNNSIHDNRAENGVVLGYGSNIVFSNNLIYNNPSGVAVRYGKPTNIQIDGNTIYNGHYGIRIHAGSTRTIIQDNILYQNVHAINDRGVGTILRKNIIE